MLRCKTLYILLYVNLIHLLRPVRVTVNILYLKYMYFFKQFLPPFLTFYLAIFFYDIEYLSLKCLLYVTPHVIINYIIGCLDVCVAGVCDLCSPHCQTVLRYFSSACVSVKCLHSIFNFVFNLYVPGLID